MRLDQRFSKTELRVLPPVVAVTNDDGCRNGRYTSQSDGAFGLWPEAQRSPQESKHGYFE